MTIGGLTSTTRCWDSHRDQRRPTTIAATNSLAGSAPKRFESPQATERAARALECSMSKTTAFIGLSGALGYDYKHAAPRVSRTDYSSPNPILENVLGLLLCYDELLFLAPQFCPGDMRHLPYVKFVTDNMDEVDTIVTALETFDQTPQDGWAHIPNFDSFSEILAEMCGSTRSRDGIDNHTHGIQLGTRMVSGNGMALDNAMRDLWMAAELGLEHTDVIFNSPAQTALNRQLESEIIKGQYFNPEKRVAATQLVSLQVPNFLGVRGSYHEALEAIRDRPDAAAFRQYLLDLDAPYHDGQQLANEISKAAFDAVDGISRRYLKDKHWFRSIGVPSVGGYLNMVTPGLGALTSIAAEAPFVLGERRFKNASRWAPFVVHLNAPGSRL